jgi:hypothetical protein
MVRPSTPQAILLVLAYTLWWVLAMPLWSLMWLYHKNKPLGQQTLRDALYKDMIILNMLCMSTYYSAKVMTFMAFNPEVVNIFGTVFYALALAMFIYFGIFVAFRYILIYHGTWIQDWSDNAVTRTAQVTVIVLTFLATMYDMYVVKVSTFWMQTSKKTKQNQPDEQSKISAVLVVTIFDVIMVIITQVKIELDNRKFKFIQSNNNRFRTSTQTNRIIPQGIINREPFAAKGVRI